MEILDHGYDTTRVSDITIAFNTAADHLNGGNSDAVADAINRAFKLAAEYGWDCNNDEQWQPIGLTFAEIIQRGLQYALERTCPYYLNGTTPPTEQKP